MWLDLLPYGTGLAFLLLGLWGRNWRRRALAAEGTMGAEDLERYEILKLIAEDNRRKALLAALEDGAGNRGAPR